MIETRMFMPAPVKRHPESNSSKIFTKKMHLLTSSLSHPAQAMKNQFFHLEALTCTLQTRQAVWITLDDFPQNPDLYNKFYSLETIDDRKNSLVDLCTKIVDKDTDRNKHKIQALLNSAVEYIMNHLSKDLSLEEMADYFRITPTYSSKIFIEYVGAGFIDFLTLARMDNAPELLLTNTYKVKEIYGMLGFSSQSYFTNAFKKYFGQSPMKYEDLHKKAKAWFIGINPVKSCFCHTNPVDICFELAALDFSLLFFILFESMLLSYMSTKNSTFSTLFNWAFLFASSIASGTISTP